MTTHIHIKTGARVFPEGYKADQVRPITAAEQRDFERAQELCIVRQRRGALLAASDWTQLPDQPESLQLAWRPYRQALRDMPESGGDWPKPPVDGG